MSWNKQWFAVLAVVWAHTGWANPTLTPGVWEDITPAVIQKGDQKTCIGQGIAVDPRDPSTLYWGNTPFNAEAGGLFKSTDAGATWKRIGAITPAFPGATAQLDMPLRVRIDPGNSSHLYVGDGVRGTSQGFFISWDGGDTFVKPQGFVDAVKAADIDNQDIYDVATDPTDFQHVLLTFHYRWGWTNTKWNTNSGVMESKDGGMTWLVHEPGSWSSGHAINFLYNPARGIGNSQTWLLGTQTAGYWRTSDSGAHWTKVSDTNITHGGGGIYYSSTGILYASGEQTTLRSTDNGVTWTSVGLPTTWAIAGDGIRMFTGKSWGGNQPFFVSSESDGNTWVPYSAQKIADGPYELAYDATNGILYSSSWMSGVFALKVGDGGAPLFDAGTSAADSGTAPVDSGAPQNAFDAGAPTGVGPPMPMTIEGGCGCLAPGLRGGHSPIAPTMLFLIGLVIVRRCRSSARR
jgi:hypothetical protein